jgi:hypothetical protein
LKNFSFATGSVYRVFIFLSVIGRGLLWIGRFNFAGFCADKNRGIYEKTRTFCFVAGSLAGVFRRFVRDWGEDCPGGGARGLGFG